tara:strand:+ start:5146 stop:5616 length:471 start_codon:yes stop_codon:yes gene_type:complete
MKIYKLTAFLLIFSACSLVDKKAPEAKPKKAKSFESITVGERGGLVGQSTLYRLLDDGMYLTVNAKGNWDTIGSVKVEEFKQAEQMLNLVKGLEVKSLGDGDGTSTEYKVEANLKPSGYVYYLWPEGREKVPQELVDFYSYIRQINPQVASSPTKD